MSKIRYIFSIAIIALLCCVTVFAYEADSFDDYAQQVADMVFGADGEINLMSVDTEDKFGCKRLFVVFSGEAYLPEGINPQGYVLYDDVGVYSFDTALATEKAYNLLRKLPDAEHVVIDSIITLDEGTPQVDEQSEFDNLQANIESKNWSFGGANVNEYKGYVESKNPDEVVIGIIDSGLATNHPYFAASGRLAQGYNVTSPFSSVADYVGHGTHVAGIAMSTSASNVKIKMYQIFNSSGRSSNLMFYNALRKAIDDEVDVINLSLSAVCADGYCHALIDEAYEKGIYIVVAAGNGDEDGNPVSVADVCPAHCSDKVITVGAATVDEYAADFSNYGPEVDICAPGVGIYSTYCDPKDNHKNTYATMKGTSMAAPMVSAFVANIISADPNMNYDRLLLMMNECAIKPDEWDAANNGVGILNMGGCASLVEYVYPVSAKFNKNDDTGEFTFDVMLENLTDDPVSFITCITFYDTYDKQIGSQIESFTVKSGKKPTYTLYLDQVPSNATKVGAYVWTKDMNPICMTREYSLISE